MDVEQTQRQPHVPAERVESLCRWAREWRTPREMIDFSNAAMSEVGSERLFRQSNLHFLTEAWTAGHFADARRATHVRLVADNWPDFELEFSDQVEQFEVTEADLQGRRRGDEYRNAPDGAITDDPVEDWVARADRIPAELSRVSQKKADKRYAGSHSIGLLIYLNPGEYGIRHEKIVQTFPYATAAAKDAFREVWILWKGKCYLVWKDGFKV